MSNSSAANSPSTFSLTATGSSHQGTMSGPLAFGANITPRFGTPVEGSASQSSFSAEEDQSDPNAAARAAKAAATLEPSNQGPSGQGPAEQTPGSAQPPFGSFTALAPGAPGAANGNGTAAGGAAAPDLSPARASADATAETAAHAPAATSAPPQEMLLRVAPPSPVNGASGGSVDIRVTQRAGDVLVTVHTPDPALQANLRQDLPELVNALDRAGFEAQTFVPRTGAASGSSFEQGTGGNQADSSNSGGAPDSRSGNAKDSGQFSQQSFGQQQQSRDRQAQRWLEQIEE
jgi:hypothetical protein